MLSGRRAGKAAPTARAHMTLGAPGPRARPPRGCSSRTPSRRCGAAWRSSPAGTSAAPTRATSLPTSPPRPRSAPPRSAPPRASASAPSARTAACSPSRSSSPLPRAPFLPRLPASFARRPCPCHPLPLSPLTVPPRLTPFRSSQVPHSAPLLLHHFLPGPLPLRLLSFPRTPILQERGLRVHMIETQSVGESK